ncbi:hypothetical protein [Bacillus sp. B1-b2]|uniref:hypothetical protein n=1 Tax=Bacillus sp. B1-b2 TaxID=2653201 RepID=UPI001261914F|nr:hypothetical protein [Bacillus sp. B1-b2]KAB7673174.1 hypothetical protein F9279_01820 [Bacillus sp. B1-b2]
MNMTNDFIVTTPFQYLIECTCPRPEHTFILNLQVGDRITITEERKYVDSLGWMLLVHINEYNFFMFIDEIEEFITEKKISSIIDMELRMNYLTYKVNESLDSLNKDLFDMYAKELNDWKQIQESISVLK